MKQALKNLSDKIITTNEVKQKKAYLENLNSNSLISNALISSRAKENLKKSNIDTFIETTKKNAISSFIENLNNKSKKEITELYNTKIEEFNKASQLYCNKKGKENEEYLSNMNTTIMKNNNLDEIIVKVNKENKLLKEQISDKENLIHKLQAKFEIFNKLKPVFEEFHKEYPEDNPVKVIKEVQQRKEEAHNLLRENSSIQNKLQDIEKYYRKELESKKREINSLHDKIKEIDKDFQSKLENYIIEINNLKQEQNNLKIHEKENLKLQNYIYHIYNKLIDNFRFNKSMTIDKSLNVKEEDFNPNLFDNEAIKTYIEAMIVSSNSEKKNKLLREVVAYSNMMLRIFAKDKLTAKFNPVETFKVIKDKLFELKNENQTLHDKLRLLKSNIKEKELKYKSTLRDLENSKRQFMNIQAKFEKQFSDKVDKVRRSAILKRKSSAKSLWSKSRPLTAYQKSVGNIINFYKQEEEKVFINEGNESNREEIKNCKNDNKFHFNDSNKDLFITNQELLTKKKASFKSCLNNFNKDESIDNKKSDRVLSSNRNKALSFKEKEDLIEPKKKNEKIKKESFKFKNSMYNNRPRSITGLFLSNNKDKIIKNSSNFKILPSHLSGINDLISHTNRLFLYKSKMNMNMNSNSENLVNERNMFIKFKNYIDSTNLRLSKLTKKSKTSYNFQKSKDVNDVVMGKINNLLNKFQNDEN